MMTPRRIFFAFLDCTVSSRLTNRGNGCRQKYRPVRLEGVFHLAITPSAEEVARINAYCTTIGVSLDRVRFEALPSEDALPHLSRGIDLVLIDGSHAFPWPFVDFFYLSRALKQHGLLIVDDIGIWSCGVLGRFLRRSPEWRLTHRLRDTRALVFRKLVTELTSEWARQPFVQPSLPEGQATHQDPAERSIE